MSLTEMSKEIERYPDPSKFDEKLFDDIHSLPNNEKIDLRFLQHHVWSEAQSFTIPRYQPISNQY